MTPDTNITKKISVTNLGDKYKANAVQAAKQLPQLNGLKLILSLSGYLCISIKNKEKHTAAIIIIF
jgi:hypothetical protein